MPANEAWIAATGTLASLLVSHTTTSGGSAVHIVANVLVLTLFAKKAFVALALLKSRATSICAAVAWTIDMAVLARPALIAHTNTRVRVGTEPVETTMRTPAEIRRRMASQLPPFVIREGQRLILEEGRSVTVFALVIREFELKAYSSDRGEIQHCIVYADHPRSIR